jgi:hypothetical protein
MRYCVRPLVTVPLKRLHFVARMERSAIRDNHFRVSTPGFRFAASGLRVVLQHRQAAWLGPTRKRLVERGNLIRAEREIARGGVVGGMVR